VQVLQFLTRICAELPFRPASSSSRSMKVRDLQNHSDSAPPAATATFSGDNSLPGGFETTRNRFGASAEFSPTRPLAEVLPERLALFLARICFWLAAAHRSLQQGLEEPTTVSIPLRSLTASGLVKLAEWLYGRSSRRFFTASTVPRPPQRGSSPWITRLRLGVLSPTPSRSRQLVVSSSILHLLILYSFSACFHSSFPSLFVIQVSQHVSFSFSSDFRFSSS
jgi:hypothetical protein